MKVRDDPITAFAPGDYEHVLLSLRDQGYLDVRMNELKPGQRHMFLRHDIDLCPARAVEMARREAEIGVKATYYFLVSTALYSICSADTRRKLAEIVDLGHEIGLHFDVEQYREQIDQLNECAERECDILSLCTQQPVESISFHRPAPSLLNRKGPIAGRRHCYEPAFFSEIAYVSDSNGGWLHGHPLEHSALEQGTAIQLLTHPIWWCNPSPQSTVATITQLFGNRVSALQADLAGTVTAFRKHLALGPPENL